MSRLPLRVLLALLLFGAAAPALARDYVVEIVLFENRFGDLVGRDRFWVPTPEPDALTLGTERAVAQGFTVVERDLGLTGSAEAMTASGAYRVLRHFAWRQPGLDADAALPISVNLGERIPLYVADDAGAARAAGAAGGTGPVDFIAAGAAPLPGRAQPVETTTVAGTLKVRLGRFLHLESKLVYTDLEAGRSFRLDESRKMRSRELHYLDNPRFGILTRILPVEDTAAPSEGSG